jgi:hypothetical protein
MSCSHLLFAFSSFEAFVATTTGVSRVPAAVFLFVIYSTSFTDKTVLFLRFRCSASTFSFRLINRLPGSTTKHRNK